MLSSFYIRSVFCMLLYCLVRNKLMMTIALFVCPVCNLLLSAYLFILVSHNSGASCFIFLRTMSNI